MKLKNVHYEYRGNDIWRIYFKDYQEADAFRNERTDEQKAQIAMLLPIFTNGKGVRYCVEAKLTGRFGILRSYVKDPTNKYFSSVPWVNLVKKIEDADSDYIFDEIDLWYDATVDKCYFRICCMNGICTEFFVKNMLNSQFGMMAQANGYYDTDTVGQGGLCIRRSCCGIGFGHHRSRYGNTEERIIFTVKNFCRGEADIVKVSPWTNTFIGTNKENEKEYSWVDFKEYVQKLSATGSDIWDIEWEYDETCPMTGTEVADKLHVYLKPEAYKRLFEGERIYISSCGIVNRDEWARLTERFKSKVDGKTGDYWYHDENVCEYCKRDVDICKEAIDATLKAKSYSTTEPFIVFNNKAMTLTEFNEFIKEANNKEEKNMGPKDTTFAEYCRRLYWGAVVPVKSVKPTKILIQGTATIIWWSDGTKTVVKCQKGDKMDPEKGIAMCVMKKFMGTNETHSNYLDFAKNAIAEYEKQQAAEKAKKREEANKRRRAAAKKKGADCNANYKRGAKGKTKTKTEPESTEPESKEES